MPRHEWLCASQPRRCAYRVCRKSPRPGQSSQAEDSEFHSFDLMPFRSVAQLIHILFNQVWCAMYSTRCDVLQPGVMNHVIRTRNAASLSWDRKRSPEEAVCGMCAGFWGCIQSSWSHCKSVAATHVLGLMYSLLTGSFGPSVLAASQTCSDLSR